MPAGSPEVRFRLGDLVEPVTERAKGSESVEQSRASVARRDLGRYYDLLSAALERVSLTDPEALLICDTLRGTWLDTPTISLLWTEVEDACRLEGLDQKWAVDGAALVDRLRGMGLAELHSIADAAERFHLEPEGPYSERLWGVGLVRPTLRDLQPRFADPKVYEAGGPAFQQVAVMVERAARDLPEWFSPRTVERWLEEAEEANAGSGQHRRLLRLAGALLLAHGDDNGTTRSAR
jgi:hypothetical protein